MSFTFLFIIKFKVTESKSSPVIIEQKMKLVGLAKFERILDLQIHRMRQKRIIRSSFGRRMKTRFSSVLDFLLDNSVDCPHFYTNCYDYEVVFGQSNRADVESLISHATELVVQLEQQCQVATFATYFLTLNGKTANML